MGSKVKAFEIRELSSRNMSAASITASTYFLADYQVDAIGAWMRMIHKAILRKVSGLAIVEENVLVHKNTASLVSSIAKQLPKDWLLLFLGGIVPSTPGGASEESYSANLVQSRGRTQGSWGVIIRAELFPFILQHLERADLPIDIGALSFACHENPDQCFTAVPPLFVPPSIPRAALEGVGASPADYI